MTRDPERVAAMLRWLTVAMVILSLLLMLAAIAVETFADGSIKF